MSNISTPRGNRFNGWFTDNSTTGTPVQKLFNNGTLVMTVTGANSVMAGAIQVETIGPAVKGTVSGDTSAYVEPAISETLDALDALGILTDNTTT